MIRKSKRYAVAYISIFLQLVWASYAVAQGVVSQEEKRLFLTPPAKGFMSWKPAESWEHSLLTGNGAMGVMVKGDPHQEVLILSHEELYLPLKKSKKPIDQGSKLEEIRQLLLAGKYEEASKIPAQLRVEEGYYDERDPFIPAFDVLIEQEPSNIEKYIRAVNFETGEATVKWQDGIGTFTRKTFVSRADSIIVISITGNARINCQIKFARRPVEWQQWGLISETVDKIEAKAEGQWLTYGSNFKIQNSNDLYGCEGVGKVFATNGKTTAEGNKINITDADEVLVLIKILPLYNKQSLVRKIKEKLNSTHPMYGSLLEKHKEIHAEIFNRVSLDLFATEDERLLYSEALIRKSQEEVPLAMIERAFDAARYNIISSTGKYPPNLQGIWSGTWTAPWSAGMTIDGNLPSAVAFNLTGNMPELMLSLFRFHEQFMEGYRENAKLLFNCRGIHIPAHVTTTPYDTDFNETWCLSYWTGGAGWMASFYFDYWLYTGDREFLKESAYPFIKEAALFYEDFLSTTEEGDLIFYPSYSPENNPQGINSQVAINSTMDVMIAKQLLRNAVAAAQELNVDDAKVLKWSGMLERMPEYQINENGVLREWLWSGLKENHSHRHSSQLYALYDLIAPEFKDNAKLKAAVVKTIEKRMDFRQKDGGGEMAFGFVQLGSAAAHIGETEKAYQAVKWLSSRYWSDGMGSYHNVGALFNTDISGGLPYVISQMLTYSEPGYIKILPALPLDWEKGRLEGLALRGQILLKSLEWDKNEVKILMASSVGQKVKIELPQEIEEVISDHNVERDISSGAENIITATFLPDKEIVITLILREE